MKQRRFLCYDIDGTYHRGTRAGESLGASVAHECVNRGLAPMNAFAHTFDARDAVDRRQAPFRHYSALHTRTLENGFFSGIKAEEVHSIAAEIAKREQFRTFVLPREVLAAATELDFCRIAISGSFYPVVEPFARSWGFDHVYGTVLDVNDEDGTYYGTPERTTVHAYRKGDLLQEIVEREGLTYDGSIVMGDSMGDASMLKLGDHQLLFNPEEALLKAFEDRPKAWLVIERRVIYTSHLMRYAPVGSDFLPGDVMRLVNERLRRIGMHHHRL